MTKFVLALFATAALTTASFGQRKETGGGGGGGGGTASQFAAAYLIATADGVPGNLLSARAETKNGVQLIGFYFAKKNGQLVEREVDKIKNKIVKDTTKDGDKVSQDMLDLLAKSNKAKTKLPEGRLFEIAKEQLKDTTFSEFKYENREGTLVIVFGETTIDATTGKVIATK